MKSQIARLTPSRNRPVRSGEELVAYLPSRDHRYRPASSQDWAFVRKAADLARARMALQNQPVWKAGYSALPNNNPPPNALMRRFARFCRTFRERERAGVKVDVAIRAMQGQLVELRAGHRKLKNLALGKAVEFARQFKQDSQAWRALCQDPFWKGGKQVPEAARRSDALRFVLRMACGRGSNGLKAASLYLKVLEPMMKKTKSAKEIAAELTKAGGARKIADAQRLSAKPNTAQAASGSQPSQIASKSTSPKVLGSPKSPREYDSVISANLNFGTAKSTLLSLTPGSSGRITFIVTRINGVVIDLKVTAFTTPSPQDPEV